MSRPLAVNRNKIVRLRVLFVPVVSCNSEKDLSPHANYKGNDFAREILTITGKYSPLRDFTRHNV